MPFFYDPYEKCPISIIIQLVEFLLLFWLPENDLLFSEREMFFFLAYLIDEGLCYLPKHIGCYILHILIVLAN